MAYWADYLTKASAIAVAPSIPNYNGIYLGYGICKYTYAGSSFAMTGSAQTFYFSVPRAHRFLRLQCAQSVISTGLNDATGLNLQLQKVDYYTQVGDIQANTNGSLAAATVIFDFGSGTGWANKESTYIIAVTGQNLDQLTVEFFVEYFTEPDTNAELVPSVYK